MIYIDDSEPDEVLEPAFSYSDVKIQKGVDAGKLYEILGEIGRGKFGTVYKCREKSTGLVLAAKFIPMPKRDDRHNVEREVEIMNLLQHHLIIQLYAAYEYQKMMCVVQELIEGGELFDRVVDDEFVLTERVCVMFIRQVCEAMEFIHRHNILHLDLKPENILCLTQEGNRIKIIDFGLARKYDPNKKLQILFGTPEFVAPEVVNFDCISYATDMWSVGVITYVLVSGLSPFMGETDIETMANVTIAKYDFDDETFRNVSSECLDFIAKLLVKDVSNRMTASECLRHKWLERRPRSPLQVSNKYGNISPEKLHLPSTSPSPIPPLMDSDNMVIAAPPLDFDTGKTFDGTKDNLKNFIERWEEHPNSPYVFDVESNVIAPLNETGAGPNQPIDSMSSSRVCSPSPCESIDTIAEETTSNARNADEKKEPKAPISLEEETSSDLATPTNESRERLFPNTSLNPKYTSAFNRSANKWNEFNGSALDLQDRSIKSYLHTFDRRNSDTTYLLGKRCGGERVNLADEIKKLSDHLLMLAEINKNINKDDIKGSTTSSISSQNTTTTSSQMSSSTSKKEKTNTSRETSARASETVSQQISRKREEYKASRLQQAIEETPKLGASTAEATNISRLKKLSITTSSSTSSFHTSSERRFSEAASIKRAKFRISQMSRDVPIGLPDTHQAINLEEAATNTKDCLLHLLEKYNETKQRNPLGRHQSISVDWNFTDNLEYRSISSINAFFQRHNNTGDYIRKLKAQLNEQSLNSNKPTK